LRFIVSLKAPDRTLDTSTGAKALSAPGACAVSYAPWATHGAALDINPSFRLNADQGASLFLLPVTARSFWAAGR
jgi:hypothetical protein